MRAETAERAERIEFRETTMQAIQMPTEWQLTLNSRANNQHNGSPHIAPLQPEPTEPAMVLLLRLLPLHATTSTGIASKVSNIRFAHAHTGGGAQTAAIKATADH